MTPLAVFEAVIDVSAVAPRIEAMLPTGVRARQLEVRTLLAGMCLAQADHRPAHLTRVHQALISLPGDDRRRLGVIADWKHGPHLLTYRQTERTFGLVARALGKDEPGGQPSQALQAVCDDLLEASIPAGFKDASRSLAVDWTDMESFSRPPPAKGGDCADPEASWGHRRRDSPGPEDELFYGYYLSAGIMMPDENGPAVPEFARRATVSSCRHDPDRDARGRDPARRRARRLRIRPPRRRCLGAAAARRRRPARPGPAPARPRPQGHPRRRDHRQREPVLPQDTAPAARARAAGPHRHQRTSRRPRRPDRRARPVQARPPHPRRRRRLPPRSVPRRHGQDPLPAAALIDDPGPRPARDPHTPRASPGLLHAADHHRPARGQRENRAETRLPLKGAPPLLRPPHRRRTRLRHRQGPRHQRHQPRLVPPHGPDTPHAVRHDAARRPQPADPRRLERPAGRQRPPRRRRPAPENPQTPPQDTRQPRRAAITAPRPRPRTPLFWSIPAPARSPPAGRHQHARKQAPKGRKQPGRHTTHPKRPAPTPGQVARNVRPKREDKPR